VVIALAASGSIKERRYDANLIVAQRIDHPQYARLAFRYRAERAKDIFALWIRLNDVWFSDGAINPVAIDAALGKHEFGVPAQNNSILAHGLRSNLMSHIEFY